MKKRTLNSRESGSAETLEKGDALLQAITKTESEAGLVQIRLLEIVRPNAEQSGDLKQLFQSLTREYKHKPRHAWLPIGYSELEAFFGIKVSERDKWFVNERGKEELTLNVLNPEFIASFNKGKRLRVQVRESIYPKDEWQADNARTEAKINPQNNQKMYHEGQYIFGNTFVVVGDPVHTFLIPDPDYRESGTFSEKNTESNDFGYEWTKPAGVEIPQQGSFDDLRKLLKK